MSNFFKSIESIADQVELQFNIKGKDGKLTVMVMPKAQLKDSAYKNMQPMVITGTAEELDAEFFSAVASPLQRAAGIVHNIAVFEQNADKLAKENDAVKKQAEAAKKEKDERLKKYAAIMKKADAFEADKNYKDAIGALKQAKEFAEKPESLDKRINDLMGKLTQGSIFDTAPAIDEPSTTNYLEDYKEEIPVPVTEDNEDNEDRNDQEGENE